MGFLLPSSRWKKEEEKEKRNLFGIARLAWLGGHTSFGEWHTHTHTSGYMRLIYVYLDALFYLDLSNILLKLDFFFSLDFLPSRIFYCRNLACWNLAASQGEDNIPEGRFPPLYSVYQVTTQWQGGWAPLVAPPSLPPYKGLIRLTRFDWNSNR